MGAPVIKCLAINVLFLNLVSSLIVLGNITTPKESNWYFLARFAFLSEAGRLEFTFEYPQVYDEGPFAAQNILLYYDDVWENVSRSKNSLSCDEKESYAQRENNQIINLTSRYPWSGCVTQIRDERFAGFKEWYICKGGRTFTSSRERWWYIVVDNCKTTKGLFLNYNITMTNGGDIFFKHFSADEFYIYQETIAMTVAYTFLITLSLAVAYALVLRQLYHTTYKIFLSSVITEFVALIAQLIYWSEYSTTGRPNIGSKNFGRFMEFTSNILFLILLILMGKGFTVTRGRISSGGIIKITGLSVIYIACSIAMFIWETVSFDPSQVLYLYDSVPGYILIAIKIASWIWFLYAVSITLKKYPEKTVFYIIFLVGFTLWFWLGASAALAAVHLIPKWMREKIVQGVTLIVIFLGHLSFLLMTWPTLANKFFPYHIKTTQVAAMELLPNNNHIEETQAVGAYAPSTSSAGGIYEPIGEQKFIDMFITKRSS